MIPFQSMLRQSGAAMVEFVIVGPLVTLLGLGSIQYGLMFFAKNHLNHATFMAARAGTTGNASQTAIQTALARALLPIYGGGSNTGELTASYGRAYADVAAYTRIEILNPTKESFDDFHGKEKDGKRTIPHAQLSQRNPNVIGANSGQSIQDANLLKLRITYGFEPKIPLMGLIYTKYLQWLDTGDDAFRSTLIASKRIPMVSHVTMLMQSDAIEDNPVSVPGTGNNGNPTDPGDPPAVDTPPPECGTIGCTVEPGGGGGDPDGGSDSGDPCLAVNPIPISGS